MNMLNAGSFQTMLPKLHSDHYEGMEVIRPMYFIRENDIIDWKIKNHLTFIQCACRFTENCAVCDNGGGGSQRYETKQLIKRLMNEYSPVVEKNIFKAATNVNLDMILGYKEGGKEHTFLDDFDEKGKEIDEEIRSKHLEEKALEKAISEHSQFVYDETFNYLLDKEKKDSN